MNSQGRRLGTSTQHQTPDGWPPSLFSASCRRTRYGGVLGAIPNQQRSCSMDAASETQPNTAPQVKGGVVPYLQVDGAMKAAEFYQRAFGAQIAFAYPVDDKGRT